MGNDNPKVTEQFIQDRLKGFLSQPRMFLKNLYVFDWESDVLILTKAVLWYEIEVKISRSDFFNDKKKIGKHNKMTDPEYKRKPNYFYYAVPYGMIKPEECPSYAGLIYVKVDGCDYTVAKSAPKLHTNKIDPNALCLADKFYFNMCNAKYEQRQSKQEVVDVHNHYSDTKAAIKEAERKERLSAMNYATMVFKKTCEHFGDYYQCTIDPEKRQRCGWCDRITKFEDLLYKYE